jgi:uncharacterized protein YndB with AHSA1/START domain
MPSAERTITIDRPPADVFAYLARGDNIPHWRPRVTEIALQSGDGGEGSVYHQLEKGPMGKQIAADFKVVEYEPPWRYAFEVIVGPARPRGSYALETAGASGTRLKFTLQCKLKGPKVFITPIVGKNFKHEMGTLDLLKQQLEAAPAGAAGAAGAGGAAGAAEPDFGRTRLAGTVPAVGQAMEIGHPAKVVVVSGPQAGRTVEFEGELVIGRADAGLELTDDEVSRRHARLIVESDGVVVEDLGSTNGTRVDGERIAQPVKLRVAGVVRVGTSELRVEPRIVPEATRLHVAAPDVTRIRPTPRPGQ